MTVIARQTPLVAHAIPGLPVTQLVVGKRAKDVAELLPRVFNLCRTAQAVAARLALGLPAEDEDSQREGLRREILRDHLMRLMFVLPGRLGTGSHALPANWEADPVTVRTAVFGSGQRCPDTADDMNAFLASGQGIAPVLSAVAACFPDGIAAVDLPLVDDRTALEPDPVENTVAARHSDHPALSAIANTHGRGPLWRSAARLFDIDACLTGTLPAPRIIEPGAALVPAARGTYSVRARVCDGSVTEFSRVTPTDHLLSPCGLLERSLATLPADRSGLAPLLLEILDPCSPVRLEETQDA
ncbi:hydrogenase expression/formation protein HupK [Roseibacterium beibuensis]|uniref:HupK protein n=1 Tax=[Roseibacterium] beibuensis TaxID=1193142 RepID=A0ABP9KV52_9RHOB|nr:hydrogenase expression/formation protein HupK [Roseibacterium beibuensis]MCS6622014.1 hydrogenase expression/formation protein HupK [Roseibacterium beibuensis]